MAEAKHTPGPWISSKFGFQVLTGDSWNTICELKGPAEWEDKRGSYEQEYAGEIQQANARLIAAAPDLLEAIKRQADNMAFVLNHMTMPDHYYERFMEELELVRDAISKAEPARQSATTVPQGGKSE
jgi:hypothetical protein